MLFMYPHPPTYTQKPLLLYFLYLSFSKIFAIHLLNVSFTPSIHSRLDFLLHASYHLLHLPLWCPLTSKSLPRRRCLYICYEGSALTQFSPSVFTPARAFWMRVPSLFLWEGGGLGGVGGVVPFSLLESHTLGSFCCSCCFLLKYLVTFSNIWLMSRYF